MSYGRRIFNALSQLIHAVLGGHEDITTSARAHRDGVLGRRWPWTWVAALLNWIDPGHTERAYHNDRDEWGESS